MTAEWDGTGLPPAAESRIARAAATSVRSSLLSVPGAAGVAACGFEPVGEVMGCIVEYMGWSGYGGCGGYYTPGFTGAYAGSVPTRTSGMSGQTGFGPYVRALYAGWDTALGRMLAESRALGADGVVGVRLTADRLGQGNREFVALGTAVRAVQPGDWSVRPAKETSEAADRAARRPFTTGLNGQDVAKLMQAGWVPAGTVVGISVAIKHDDWMTRQQASSWQSGNTEVQGYTELVTSARADARHQFARRVAGFGAEAAIVSAMTLDIWEIEPSENHRDHVAEATVVGTAIAQFHRGATAPTQSLTVLPLRPAPEPTTRKSS